LAWVLPWLPFLAVCRPRALRCSAERERTCAKCVPAGCRPERADLLQPAGCALPDRQIVRNQRRQAERDLLNAASALLCDRASDRLARRLMRAVGSYLAHAAFAITPDWRVGIR
jgi:hypothetical protein